MTTRRSTRTATLVAACVVFGAGLAWAEHASVRLGYSRAKAASACPDEATFRGLVAARLGYDPFTGAGSRTLAVDFQRRGDEVVGHLSLGEEKDPNPRQRTLHAPAQECFELATSLALVAAVALDPDAAQSRTPAPAPPPPNPPSASASAPAAPAPAPAPPAESPPPTNRNLELQLSGLLALGVVPAPTGGLRAGASFGLGPASIGAEAAFLFAGSRENPTGNGEVSAWVLNGALVPCVRPVAARWLLGFCAVASLGVMRSNADHVTRAAPTSDLFATVGPRAALGVMLSESIGVGLAADVPVALSRVHLFIEEGGVRHEVWAAPPVGFIGALSLLARLK